MKTILRPEHEIIRVRELYLKRNFPKCNFDLTTDIKTVKRIKNIKASESEKLLHKKSIYCLNILPHYYHILSEGEQELYMDRMNKICDIIYIFSICKNCNRKIVSVVRNYKDESAIFINHAIMPYKIDNP